MELGIGDARRFYQQQWGAGTSPRQEVSDMCMRIEAGEVQQLNFSALSSFLPQALKNPVIVQRWYEKKQLLSVLSEMTKASSPIGLDLSRLDGLSSEDMMNFCNKLEGLPIAWLNITSTRVTNLNFLRSNEKLKTLYLQYCDLLEDISGVRKLPSLEELTIWRFGSRSKSEKVLDLDLSPLKDIPNLKSLSLGKFTGLNVEVLKSDSVKRLELFLMKGIDLRFLTSISQLEELSLSCCTEFIQLSTLGKLAVKKLDLSGTDINDSDLGLVAKNTRLQTLNVYNCMALKNPVQQLEEIPGIIEADMSTDGVIKVRRDTSSAG